MATLKPNSETPGNYDLTELTGDDLDMIQVALIELQAKLKREEAFPDDLVRLVNLFHAIDSELIALG